MPMLLLARYEREIRLILFGLIYLTAFTPILVGSSFLFPFVFPKAVFFQTLVQAALLLYLALLSVSRQYLPRKSSILILALLFVASLTVSTFAGADPSFSFWSKAERMDGLFQYLHLAAFLLILLGVLRREADWLRLLKFNLGVAVLIGVVSLISKYFPAALSLGSQARLAGTFGNSAFLATYFLVMFFLALIFALRGKTAQERWWFGGLGLFFLIILLLAGTRGAFIGIAAGIFTFLAFLVLADPQRWLKKAIATLLVLLLFAGGFLLFRDFFQRVSPVVTSRLLGLAQFPPARIISWQIGLDGFRERPLFGWGPEGYIYVFNAHFIPDIHTYDLSLFDRAHNKIVDLLVMQGIVGLLIYLALYGAIVWELGRVARKKLVNPIWPAGFLGLMAGYFVQNLVLFEMPTSGLIFFFLLAFLSWLASELRAEERRLAALPAIKPKETPQIKTAGLIPTWLLPVAFVGIAFIWTIAIWHPMRASRGVVATAAQLGFISDTGQSPFASSFTTYKRARYPSTFLDREIDTAVGRRLRDAVAARPQAISDPVVKEFAEALIAALREDSKRHPLDYDVLIEAGNLSSLLEQTNPALASQTEAFWNQAIPLAPKREDAYQQFSLWYSAKGDFAKADEMLQKILSLNDRIGLFWWYKAALEARRGNEGGVKEALSRAEAIGYNWRNFPSNLEFLGATFARQNRLSVAIPYYERIVELTRRSEVQIDWPTAFRAHASLAKLYLDSGRTEEAIAIARRVLEISPATDREQVRDVLESIGFSL